MSNRKEFIRIKLIKLKQKKLESRLYYQKLINLIEFYEKRLKENDLEKKFFYSIPENKKFKIKENNQID